MEPNPQESRSVEDQLKRWAQSRKDAMGPPFELNDFHRQQLQDEVARTYGADTPPQTAGRPLWRLLLPRFAVAGSLAAGLLLILSHMDSRLRPGTTLRLALEDGEDRTKREAPEAASAKEAPAPAALVPTAPAPALEDLKPLPAPESKVRRGASSLPESESAPRLTARATAPEPVAVSAAPDLAQPTLRPSPEATRQPQREGTELAGDASSSDAGRATADRVSSRYGLSPRPPTKDRSPSPMAAAVRSDKTTTPQSLPSLQPSQVAATLQSEAVAESGEYATLGQYAPVQSLRRNLNSPPRSVLARFALQRQEARIRVVDADNSVYLGQTTPSPAAGVEAARQGQSSAQTSTGGFAFEVRGVNRTTGQEVVFCGVWTAGDPSHVQGSALIGSGSRLVIDAALVSQ